MVKYVVVGPRPFLQAWPDQRAGRAISSRNSNCLYTIKLLTSSKTMDSNDRCGMLGRVVLVVGWEKYQCKSSSSLINVESARRKKSICSTQVEYSIESASLYDIDSY